MYATGANAKHTSTSGLPGTTTARGTFSSYQGSYVTPPGSEQAPANGESLVVYNMEPGATGGYGIANTSNYAQMSRGGFGGTWFAKLYGSVKLAPWYKVTAMGLYIGDTTANGNTFGQPVKYHNSSAILRNDTTIGWELDLINEIQIYNNLRFFVGGGFLIAGPAMDVAMSTLTSGVSVNRAAPNPWAVRTRLQYTF